MAEFALNPAGLDWLLEEEHPGVRYLALRDLMDLAPGDGQIGEARLRAHQSGPIRTILDNMQPGGYWVEPGPGYYPKYQGSVWSLITLAQLGASLDLDERLAVACEYILEQALIATGQISTNGAPSGTADCLQGNLCAALLALGVPAGRLAAAFEWMARTVTGEGIAPMEDKHAPLRYYAGKCGPFFACGSNNKLPCAWGGVKVMLAFARLPAGQRSGVIQRAIDAGVDFFLSVDPATAGYPNGWSDKPSGNWWKFGFPVFYVTDLLQLCEALVELGYGQEARLQPALALIAAKADPQGRWALEYDYSSKTWLDFGAKKQPNKWVTLRAWQVLRQAAWVPSR